MGNKPSKLSFGLSSWN